MSNRDLELRDIYTELVHVGKEMSREMGLLRLNVEDFRAIKDLIYETEKTGDYSKILQPILAVVEEMLKSFPPEYYEMLKFT